MQLTKSIFKESKEWNLLYDYTVQYIPCLPLSGSMTFVAQKKVKIVERFPRTSR
jgi:HKD family nuclease